MPRRLPARKFESSSSARPTLRIRMYGDSDLIRYCVCRSIKKLHYLLQCDSLRLLLYRGCRIIRCARNIRRSYLPDRRYPN